MVALTQPKPISLLEWPPEPLDAVACRLSGQAGPLGRLDYEERTISVRAFFFVVADEIDPFARKVVRKVAFPERLRGNPELLRRILQPEKFGFFPRDPVSLVSIGEHVGLENTSSRFISASERPFGSANYPGKRYWIDLD